MRPPTSLSSLTCAPPSFPTTGLTPAVWCALGGVDAPVRRGCGRRAWNSRGFESADAPTPNPRVRPNTSRQMLQLRMGVVCYKSVLQERPLLTGHALLPSSRRFSSNSEPVAAVSRNLDRLAEVPQSCDASGSGEVNSGRERGYPNVAGELVLCVSWHPATSAKSRVPAMSPKRRGQVAQELLREPSFDQMPTKSGQFLGKSGQVWSWVRPTPTVVLVRSSAILVQPWANLDRARSNSRQSGQHRPTSVRICRPSAEPGNHLTKLGQQLANSWPN